LLQEKLRGAHKRHPNILHCHRVYIMNRQRADGSARKTARVVKQLSRALTSVVTRDDIKVALVPSVEIHVWCQSR
jgi:hypothetical protein